jgi:hypothetical protein
MGTPFSQSRDTTIFQDNAFAFRSAKDKSRQSSVVGIGLP